MQVQPYLFFHGRCEEAVEFYRKALGAEAIELMRFKDSPNPAPPGYANKIMHGTFRVGDTTVLVSDGSGEGSAGFQGFALAIMVPNEAAADRVFAALAERGQVGMPLGKTFWSPRFGMVTDRFGVSWMVNTVSTPAA
jgi:PhnB protein